MAFAAQNTNVNRQTFEEHLDSLESKWHSEGSPKMHFVTYELRDKLIYETRVSTPGVFYALRGWKKFVECPSCQHGYVESTLPNGEKINANIYWNDLEVAIVAYNTTCVVQNLMWMLSADPHCANPRHRRQRLGAQPKQKPPFPEQLMACEGEVSGVAA